MLIDKLKQWLNNGNKGEGDVSTINLSHGKMIARWLTCYQEQHQLIRFTTEEDAPESDTILTGILFIDLNSKRFFLEELRPKSASKRLQPGMTLYFVASVEGVKHKFTARYIRSEELPQGNAHLCEFPTTIEQIQLRNAFRVKLPRSTPVTISLTHPIKAFISGQAADLSATGARLRVEGAIQHEPIQGDIYTLCRLTLPDGTEIFCQAQLMHWRYVPEHKATYLGLMFLKLESMHERTLGRFLTDIQRREKELRPGH